MRAFGNRRTIAPQQTSQQHHQHHVDDISSSSAEQTVSSLREITIQPFSPVAITTPSGESNNQMKQSPSVNRLKRKTQIPRTMISHPKSLASSSSEYGNANSSSGIPNQHTMGGSLSAAIISSTATPKSFKQQTLTTRMKPVLSTIATNSTTTTAATPSSSQHSRQSSQTKLSKLKQLGFIKANATTTPQSSAAEISDEAILLEVLKYQQPLTCTPSAAHYPSSSHALPSLQVQSYPHINYRIATISSMSSIMELYPMRMPSPPERLNSYEVDERLFAFPSGSVTTAAATATAFGRRGSSTFATTSNGLLITNNQLTSATTTIGSSSNGVGSTPSNESVTAQNATLSGTSASIGQKKRQMNMRPRSCYCDATGKQSSKAAKLDLIYRTSFIKNHMISPNKKNTASNPLDKDFIISNLKKSIDLHQNSATQQQHHHAHSLFQSVIDASHSNSATNADSSPKNFTTKPSPSIIFKSSLSLSDQNTPNSITPTTNPTNNNSKSIFFSNNLTQPTSSNIQNDPNAITLSPIEEVITSPLQQQQQQQQKQILKSSNNEGTTTIYNNSDASGIASNNNKIQSQNMGENRTQIEIEEMQSNEKIEQQQQQERKSQTQQFLGRNRQTRLGTILSSGENTPAHSTPTSKTLKRSNQHALLNTPTNSPFKQSVTANFNSISKRSSLGYEQSTRNNNSQQSQQKRFSMPQTLMRNRSMYHEPLEEDAATTTEQLPAFQLSPINPKKQQSLLQNPYFEKKKKLLAKLRFASKLVGLHERQRKKSLLYSKEYYQALQGIDPNDTNSNDDEDSKNKEANNQKDNGKERLLKRERDQLEEQKNNAQHVTQLIIDSKRLRPNRKLQEFLGLRTTQSLSSIPDEWKLNNQKDISKDVVCDASQQPPLVEDIQVNKSSINHQRIIMNNSMLSQLDNVTYSLPPSSMSSTMTLGLHQSPKQQYPQLLIHSAHAIETKYPFSSATQFKSINQLNKSYFNNNPAAMFTNNGRSIQSKRIQQKLEDFLNIQKGIKYPVAVAGTANTLSVTALSTIASNTGLSSSNYFGANHQGRQKKSSIDFKVDSSYNKRNSQNDLLYSTNVSKASMVFN